MIIGIDIFAFYMPKMLINKINKGANRGKTQPVQHRGLEAFWKDVLEYNNFEANFYSIASRQGKKQQVPWHGGTGCG